MSGVLLDTNVISEYSRTKAPVSPALVNESAGPTR